MFLFVFINENVIIKSIEHTQCAYLNKHYGITTVRHSLINNGN